MRRILSIDGGGIQGIIPGCAFSALAHDRVFKVARTIADLDHADRVSAKHLAEPRCVTVYIHA